MFRSHSTQVSQRHGCTFSLSGSFILFRTRRAQWQAAFHQAGTPLADVPYDIDSVPRDPVKPDIGAVEFTCGPPVFNVQVSPTCLGDSTTFMDKSTNITPGATYGWDFDGDYVPDDEYIFTQSNYTFKYYFNAQGTHTVNFIVSQIGGCNDYTQ